jgi:hypothetical protein
MAQGSLHKTCYFVQLALLAKACAVLELSSVPAMDPTVLCLYRPRVGLILHTRNPSN